MIPALSLQPKLSSTQIIAGHILPLMRGDFERLFLCLQDIIGGGSRFTQGKTYLLIEETGPTGVHGVSLLRLVNDYGQEVYAVAEYFREV